MTHIQGIIAYPVTPFNKSGIGVDEVALVKVTEHLLSTEPNGIAFLGSAGESAYLSEEEWRRAAKVGVETANGKTQVILGIGELTTAAAVTKAKYAKQIGADMLMVIPVSYWRLNDEEIFEHFRAVSEVTDLPILAYNNPATSGVDMSPTLLLRLVSQLPTVVAIKESSGDLNRMHAIRTESNGEVPFYNGANHLALEALSAGAAGWCTAAPNLLDREPARLFELIRSEKTEEARDLFYSILPVLKFIVIGGLPATIKSGLSLRGLKTGLPRKPVLPLTDSLKAELSEHLKTLGIGEIA